MRRKFTKHPILASTDSSLVRFEVGQEYRAQMLYGGISKYKVVSRTADTVSLEESHVSEDDWSQVDDGTQEYNIVIQDIYDSNYENVVGKQETVCIWEYKGHEGYLFASGGDITTNQSKEIQDENDEDSVYI